MAMDDDNEFTLADFADLDVSEISEFRFETLPMGVYEWEVIDCGLTEDVDKEGAKRFNGYFELKIASVKSVLEPGVDKETLPGKTLKINNWINPGKEQKEVQEQIGRLRAFVTDIGCDSAGKLGAIVANTKGHIFTSKLMHQKDKTDSTIIYSKLKFDPVKKKAA